MRLLLIVFLTLFSLVGRAQCGSCSATTFNVDLSANTDTVYTIQSVRNGNCCTRSNCVRFNITLNPGANFVNFSVASPAPNGSATNGVAKVFQLAEMTNS
jgi:hypothetical protein